MKDDPDNRDLYSGMIRLHILHHAEHEAIFGRVWRKSSPGMDTRSALELSTRFSTV
jgi:hypothetical protein